MRRRSAAMWATTRRLKLNRAKEYGEDLLPLVPSSRFRGALVLRRTRFAYRQVKRRPRRGAFHLGVSAWCHRTWTGSRAYENPKTQRANDFHRETNSEDMRRPDWETTSSLRCQSAAKSVRLSDRHKQAAFRPAKSPRKERGYRWHWPSVPAALATCFAPAATIRL